jgi:hypothetical protein
MRRENKVTNIETVPAELDWTKIQMECSIKSAFESLRAAVEEDIESYNVMLQLLPTYRIKLSSEISSNVVVSRGSSYDAHVEIQRRGNSVEIRHSGEPTISVTPVFSNLGRCRWKLNDEELEQWQVRKIALEKLLFPPQVSM